MKHQVDDSLASLLIEVDSLRLLEDNPRRGSIEAIMASYQEFGQLKPIVVRPNQDGTATVIAGNHQLQAARRLGWTHIAAVQYDADDARAIAFALADNRTNELGYTDTSDLNMHIQSVYEEFPELFEGLGWDTFEMAAISEQAWRADKRDDSETGFVPPVLISAKNDDVQQIAVEQTEEGARLVADTEVDNRQIATTGSTLIGASGVTNAIVQYSLVFDNVEQQKKWYSFIRWLRDDPAIDGDTTAERLMNFIDAHADF